MWFFQVLERRYPHLIFGKSFFQLQKQPRIFDNNGDAWYFDNMEISANPHMKHSIYKTFLHNRKKYIKRYNNIQNYGRTLSSYKSEGFYRNFKNPNHCIKTDFL
jgi:hypothetical protein